jgi:predicted methyltransferase
MQMAVPLVKQVHNKLANYIKEGDRVVDATMGNGFDTLFLAESVGEQGKVYAFDLQAEALVNTEARLKECALQNRVRLIQDSHEHLSDYLAQEKVMTIRCVLFNLGYLPCSDKIFQTHPNSTLKALDSALAQLATPGIISVLAYTGHAGGREEAEVVKEWAAELTEADYRVTIEIPERVRNSPPELILVEKIL